MHGIGVQGREREHDEHSIHSTCSCSRKSAQLYHLDLGSIWQAEPCSTVGCVELTSLQPKTVTSQPLSHLQAPCMLTLPHPQSTASSSYTCRQGCSGVRVVGHAGSDPVPADSSLGSCLLEQRHSRGAHIAGRHSAGGVGLEDGQQGGSAAAPQLQKVLGGLLDGQGRELQQQVPAAMQVFP